MYRSNIWMRSRNLCCPRKAVIIAKSESVSVCLVIQHAMQMFPIIFTYFPSLDVQYFYTLYHERLYCFFKQLTKHETCVLMLSTRFIQNISHFKKNSARYYYKFTQVLTQRTSYYCKILKKFEFSRQILEKHTNVNFHENPPSVSRIVPYRQME